jgi:NADH-quinone oxidoreductase subunit J
LVQLNGEFVAFFILSVMAIGGAVFMINLTRAVHMALALAFTFFSIAGLYLLLNAEFLAVVQVLIYTGAITILMLFMIMLTRHQNEEEAETFGIRQGISFLAVAAFFGTVMWVIHRTPLPAKTADTSGYTVERIGHVLFQQQVIPFELVSVLLLAALVGAVVLARKEES